MARLFNRLLARGHRDRERPGRAASDLVMMIMTVTPSRPLRLRLSQLSTQAKPSASLSQVMVEVCNLNQNFIIP